MRTVRLPSPAARARWRSASPTAGSSASTADARARKRSRDRPLGARLDVERGEREPGAVLGESARGGRKALLLGERLLERANPLADERGPLSERDALALGAPGSLGCLGSPRARDVRRRSAQPARSPQPESPRGTARAALRRLRAQLEPLDSALQPVARRDRSLAPSGRVRELLLGSRAVAEQSLESALRASLRERRSRRDAPPPPRAAHRSRRDRAARSARCSDAISSRASPRARPRSPAARAAAGACAPPPRRRARARPGARRARASARRDVAGA